MVEKYYFAYGSNLNIFQMIKRVGEWRTSQRAYLEGYKLVFNYLSGRWDGYTANIQKTGNNLDKVYGVVYLLKEEKIAVMSNYECRDPEYTSVKLEDGSVIPDVAVYIWDKKEPRKSPPKVYADIMFEGLIQHGYTQKLIVKIRQDFSL